MKTLLFLIALVFTGMQAMGQATRSVSYNYFHSVVVADTNNGDDCTPGSPNCIGGGRDSSYITNSCNKSIKVYTFSDGEFKRFYKAPDVNLTTLQSLRYILRNKTQGDKVIYDFTVSRGSGWANSSPSVNVNPYSNFTSQSFAQVATVIVDNPDGNIKIVTPSIPLLFAEPSDDLEQEIIPTLTSSCSGNTVTSTDGFNYAAAGCLAVSSIIDAIPGIIANNGQTSANGAMLYDVKFSSVSDDKAGWYLLNGRPCSTIANLSARQAAIEKFGTNLPNMAGLYTVAETTAGQAYNAAGVINNQITVTNSNIYSATLSAQSAGSHSHSVYPPSSYGWVGYNGSGTYTGNYSFDNSSGEPSLTFATNSAGSTSGDGAHTHNVELGVGNPTPISIQPRSAKLYQFVYLGQ